MSTAIPPSSRRRRVIGENSWNGTRQPKADSEGDGIAFGNPLTGGGHGTSTREPVRRATDLVWVVSTLLLFLPGPLAVSAQENAERLATQTQQARKEQRPIAATLIETLDLVTRELSQQREALKHAQTDRERELIQAHITFLEEERQSLQHLLHLLVGSTTDIEDTAREQQQKLRDERIQRQLEQDKRFPRTR